MLEQGMLFHNRKLGQSKTSDDHQTEVGLNEVIFRKSGRLARTISRLCLVAILVQGRCDPKVAVDCWIVVVQEDEAE